MLKRQKPNGAISAEKIVQGLKAPSTLRKQIKAV